MNNLIIPPKIKIGFQNRTDTYTGKLAYVIYFDNKGILRKEASWNNWRDKKIDPIEFDNIPTEGFVLNKKVGGYKSDWNYRQTYVRIYDPRNFEFEITVPNLLFILSEYDCSRGKGLEGKFVYAWDKKDLVLLPTESESYRISKDYTELQKQSVKSNNLIKGASYLTKNQRILTYLDRFEVYNIKHNYEYNFRKKKKDEINKKYVFWNSSEKEFEFHDNLSKIAKLNSDIIVSNYAHLLDKYYKSIYGSKVTKLFIKQDNKTVTEWFYKLEHEESFISCTSNFDYNKNLLYINYNYKIYIKNGEIEVEPYKKVWYESSKYNYNNYYNRYDSYDITSSKIGPFNQSLWAELESGSQYQVGYYGSLIFWRDNNG